jgi:peptide/nickel transport system permease protein
MVGMLLSAPILAVAALAPWVAPADPNVINTAQRLLPPGAGHLMGTDELGRDVLSRVIYGARISLEVSISSTVVGMAVGCVLGAVAGYRGRLTDEILMRLTDALIAFPSILLALVLVVVMGAGVVTVIIAIAAIRIPLFARTIRGSVLAEREREYVEAARSVGQRPAMILLRHIVPNVLAPVIVLATTTLASGIIIEASLSFLGLGVSAPDVTWGGMLNSSRQYMQDYPWMTFFPGLALSLAVLGANLLGDGVRDLMDPRLRTVL